MTTLVTQQIPIENVESPANDLNNLVTHHKVAKHEFVLADSANVILDLEEFVATIACCTSLPALHAERKYSSLVPNLRREIQSSGNCSACRTDLRELFTPGESAWCGCGTSKKH